MTDHIRDLYKAMTHSHYADDQAEAAACRDFLFQHHAAIRRDAERLDWLERNALYVTLDGREHDEMTIGADRGSLDAAIAKENERG